MIRRNPLAADPSVPGAPGPGLDFELSSLVAEYDGDDSGYPTVYSGFEIETSRWGIYAVLFYSDLNDVSYWNDLDERWQRPQRGVIRMDRGQIEFVCVRHYARKDTYFLLQRRYDKLWIWELRPFISS